MTRKACNKILEGLREALAIVRGEEEPYRVTVIDRLGTNPDPVHVDEGDIAAPERLPEAR